MTYREKLKKEHPKKVDSVFFGGCDRCPGTYGYSDEISVSNCPFGGHVSDENCKACWDREIPGESNKLEEFAPGTSYAEFVDGHKEEVLYYEIDPSRRYIHFITRSGAYLFEDCLEEIRLSVSDNNPSRFRPFIQMSHFYRIRYDITDGFQKHQIDYIKTVVVDTRIKHDYCIATKDGGRIRGGVWVERDAPVETIREAVLDDAVVVITTEEAAE